MEKNARGMWLDEIKIFSNVVPKFPLYSAFEDRLKSFKNWSSSRQQPDKLCEAGFFFTGVDDRVVCHHCGIRLWEWNKFDDPWVEHAYWFPRCNFVLAVKGETFIEQAWKNKTAS